MPRSLKTRISAVVVAALAAVGIVNAVPAQAAVVAPTVVLSNVQSQSNALYVDYAASNFTTSMSYTVRLTVTCSGTHAAQTECFGYQSSGMFAPQLAPGRFYSYPSPQKVGSTYVSVYDTNLIASGTTENGTLLIDQLANGAEYSITGQVMANYSLVGSPSAAVTGTAGAGGPTNVKMTSVGPATRADNSVFGCWGGCMGPSSNTASGSKVKVEWTPGTNLSFNYNTFVSGSTGARTNKTFQATGYAVVVIPQWVAQTQPVNNPMVDSYASRIYLDSTSSASQIAQQGSWNSQTQADGCSAVDSGALTTDGSQTMPAFNGAWYVDGTSTSSVTLNGCHFARDEKYIAMVEPVYMPANLLTNFTDIKTGVPAQWDLDNKIVPMAVLTNNSSIVNNSSLSGANFPVGVTAPVAADGGAGNLPPDLGAVSDVKAVPASTTDPAQKGTLKVTWSAPKNDLYFSQLSWDVYTDPNNQTYSSYRLSPLGKIQRVTTGLQASAPTKYIVTAMSQDASPWFSWLGWNGIGARAGAPTCTAIAPATTCTLTGLSTWTKYAVYVQAQNDYSTGWTNMVSVNPSTGVGSTIWPLAPSEPLDITASNPNKTSTTIAWKTPTSVGGPAGVVISKYTASMVPQLVPVTTLSKRGCDNYGSCQVYGVYGTNGNYDGGPTQLDALPGTNNYVGMLGFNCQYSPTGGGYSQAFDAGSKESCYNIFDAKGLKYQYKLMAKLGATSLYDTAKYKVARINWMHMEKWGYLLSFGLTKASNLVTAEDRTVIAYLPFTSASATFDSVAGVVPGGPDFSSAVVVTNEKTPGNATNSTYPDSVTNFTVDAHMLDATTVLGDAVTTSDAGTPASAFSKYTLSGGTFTKDANPMATVGCVSSPKFVCTDFASIPSNFNFSASGWLKPLPVLRFSLNPSSGNIYFRTPYGYGGVNQLTPTLFRVSYDKVNGTYGSPEAITIGTGNGYGCWGSCSYGLGTTTPQFEDFQFDDDGLMTWSGSVTQYSETSNGFSVVDGSYLPLQSWDWWWTPRWISNRGGISNSVRTPGGALFSVTYRWIGDTRKQDSWNSWGSTLSVMLDTKSHTCTTTGALTCTATDTVSGAAYAISVYATNKESNGKLKDGPAGAFANVVAGLPNQPKYIGATFGSVTFGSAVATITFGPSVLAGGAVDKTITKYTCKVYDLDGNVVSTTDVTPPADVTVSSKMTCAPPALTSNASYVVAITATNSDGTSFPASAPQLLVGAPMSPQSVTYNTDVTPAKLQWETVGAGTSKVTIYSSNPYPGPATPSANVTCSVTDNSCTPSGLASGTTYYALVCTTNAFTQGADATTGAWQSQSPGSTPSNCSVKQFSTPELPKPDAPSLTLSSGSGSLKLTWTHGATNGTTITGYTVTVSPSAGSGCTGLAAAATSCTLTGLTNGTVYTVTIKVNYTVDGKAGTATVTDSASAPPFAPPAAPAKPTATAGISKATVLWTALTPPSGMVINSYTVTSAPGGKTCTVDAPATTCDVTGLTNGTAYTFTVTANYTNGNVNPAVTDDTAASAASTAVTPQATAPKAAPGNVSAEAGNAKAKVVWDLVTDDGGSAITQYVVTASPGGKTCTATAPATSCEVTGLTNGTDYTFTVAAKNAKGTGASSSPAGPVTPKATVPQPPTAVKVTVPTATSLRVSWTAPADNGGSPLTGYTVSASDGSTTKTCTAAAGTTTCDVTGLTRGTPYTISVVATNAVGDSSPANAADPVAPSVAPSTITAPTATVGSTSATVTWTEPSDDGGSTITKYTVTSSPGGKTCTVTSPFPSPLSCTVTGLTIGTKYTFSVTATNAAGTSTASGASNSITGASAPTGMLAPTVTAPASNNSNGQLTVSWKAPTAANGTVSGYTVTASPGGATCTTTGALTCTVTGLTNGTAYTFTVKATNEIADSAASPASAAVKPSTLPGAPTNVTATAGVASATVAWSAPTDNGGAAITKYTVTSSPGGKTCTTTGALTCKVTGLTNGTAYTFSVTATNINGDSSPSDASTSVSPAPLPTAPAITGAARSANGAITVSFTRPADPAGAPVTGYTVTSAPGGKTCVISDPSVLSCAVTGLTAGTKYTFTVVATNRIGNSPASTASAAVVAANAPGAPTAVTAGLDPKNKTVDRQAMVTWKAPASNGGVAISGYLVTAAPGGATCIGGATATSCVVKGLNNGTAYTFSVVAINDPGFKATASTKRTLTSVASASSAAFTPTWSNQLSGAVVLTPPTGPTGGSTVSLQYSMPVTINFSPTPPATGYTVRLNGRAVGSVSAGDCSLTKCSYTWTPANKYVLRTSDVITVTSSNGLTITMAPPAPKSLAVAELHYGTGLSTVGAGSDEAAFLDAVAQLVKDNGYQAVTLTGYTDDDGSASSNLTLSTKRATNASAYLKTALGKIGVTNVTLTAVGKGIDKTYASNCGSNPVEDCAKNRRVSVQVSGQISAPGTPAAPTATLRSGAVSVAWTAPANNGAAITSYSVYYTTDSDYLANGTPLNTTVAELGNWSLFCSPTTTTCTAKAGVTLASATGYRFVVVAINAKGTSQVSAVSKAITTP